MGCSSCAANMSHIPKVTNLYMIMWPEVTQMCTEPDVVSMDRPPIMCGVTAVLQPSSYVVMSQRQQRRPQLWLQEVVGGTAGISFIHS